MDVTSNCVISLEHYDVGLKGQEFSITSVIILEHYSFTLEVIMLFCLLR